jgi:hypothetical protein
LKWPEGKKFWSLHFTFSDKFHTTAAKEEVVEGCILLSLHGVHTWPQSTKDKKIISLSTQYGKEEFRSYHEG